MGEIFLYQECRQRMDLATDEYVIPNRATARSKAQWVYSHVKCLEGRESFSKMSDSEVKRLSCEMLEVHLSGMDAGTLRRLGLQRIEVSHDPRGPKGK